jgi:hypothetical protein
MRLLALLIISICSSGCVTLRVGIIHKGQKIEISTNRNELALTIRPKVVK